MLDDTLLLLDELPFLDHQEPLKLLSLPESKYKVLYILHDKQKLFYKFNVVIKSTSTLMG